ncbi:MAG: hypothetical protein HFJ43_02135 [Clostridia bacterium]|nr:hypothetical protein [Clostridia bacterium]
MNKKKVIAIISFILIILFALLPVVNATVAGLSVNTSGKGKIINFGKNLIGLAQIIGVGVASVMLIVLAIKYIVSSPEDKAEIKKHAVVYVVGAIFIFAASSIIELLKLLSSNIQ